MRAHGWLPIVLSLAGCRPSAPVAEQPAAEPPAPAATAAAPSKPQPLAIADTPPAAGEIGTSGWVHVISAEPAGAWVLVCQAREDTDKDGKTRVQFGMHGEMFGDEPRPYLVRGAGAGEAIDDIVAVDPARRFLIVARGELVELIDTQSDARVALRDADARYEAGGVFAGARAAFDARGEHVVYLRAPAKKKGRRMLVVRRLEGGDERVVDPGAGTLLDAGIVGGWVRAWVFDPIPGQMLGGESRSGPAHTVGGRRCRPDVPHSTMNGRERWAPLAGGTAFERKEVQTAVGAALVVRGNDGALSLEHDGKAVTITPPACRAVLLARSHDHGSVLFACASSDETGALHLWRDGKARALGLDVAIAGTSGVADEDDRRGDRLAQVESARGRVLVDMLDGRMHVLDHDYVIATHEAKVLLHRREGPLSLFDLDGGTLVELPGVPPDMMAAAQQGRLFAAGPRSEGETRGVLVDLDAEAALGTFPGPALAVSTTGWVLSPTPPARPTADEGGGGPLRWARPTRE